MTSVRLGLDGDTTAVLCASNLRREKRVDLFCRAVAHARGCGADVVGLVAGDGPERDAVAAAADPQAVRLLGQREDVGDLLVPSTWPARRALSRRNPCSCSRRRPPVSPSLPRRSGVAGDRSPRRGGTSGASRRRPGTESGPGCDGRRAGTPPANGERCTRGKRPLSERRPRWAAPTRNYCLARQRVALIRGHPAVSRCGGTRRALFRAPRAPGRRGCSPLPTVPPCTASPAVHAPRLPAPHALGSPHLRGHSGDRGIRICPPLPRCAGRHGRVSKSCSSPTPVPRISTHGSCASSPDPPTRPASARSDCSGRAPPMSLSSMTTPCRQRAGPTPRSRCSTPTRRSVSCRSHADPPGRAGLGESSSRIFASPLVTGPQRWR